MKLKELRDEIVLTTMAVLVVIGSFAGIVFVSYGAIKFIKGL